MSARTQQLSRARKAAAEGRLQEAVAACRELIRRDGNDAEALHLLGVFLSVGGKGAGLPYLRRAAALAPGEPAHHVSLAQALAAMGLVDEAIEPAREAVRHNASAVEAHLLLGNLLAMSGNLVEAEASYRRAIEIEPNSPHAHNNLGNIFAQAGRTAEAVAAYRQALDCDQQSSDAWANLGAALLSLDQPVDAAAACRRAVSITPSQAAAWLTLGAAEAAEGKWGEALTAYDAALTLNPTSLDVRYNRSLAMLALDDCRGWTDYRLRHEVEPAIKIHTGLPRWAGESLSGRSILVRREQGIGTQIMMCGCLPALVNAAQHVVVECDRRLRPVLERSYPGVAFLTPEELWDLDSAKVIAWRIPKPDLEAPISDLLGDLLSPGKRFMNQAASWVEDVPPPQIKVDAALVAKWRSRLALLPPRLKIGISWRGGGNDSARRRRSIPLEEWAPLFSRTNAQFVSLQYGDVEDELARATPTIHRWSDFDPRDDLDDLIALAALLDVVITIDNSTAHLAAAAGANVWTLLPAAADWRWLTGREDTPWYPSMKLFRATSEDWGPIMSVVAANLAQLSSMPRASLAG